MPLKPELNARLKLAPHPRLNAARAAVLQKARAEQRNHGHGDEVGGEKRNHHRERHRGEEKLAHAGQQA